MPRTVQILGKREAIAGGSDLQGEDPLTCAIRELQEETGICISDKEKSIESIHNTAF